MFSHHHESPGQIAASADAVFALTDDQERLSAHMSKPSWRTVGAVMKIELDEQRGRSVGSVIKLTMRMLGMELSVEETVLEREPPFRKIWETTGEPRLLVIAKYRMGFEIAPQGDRSLLRVFIDYDLPEKGISRFLGLFLGRYYARWCTQRMVDDAVATLTPSPRFAATTRHA